MNQITNILEMPMDLEKQLKNYMLATLSDAIKEFKEQHLTTKTKEWMSLKEAADYIGVSYNTLIKFRVMGLKVCEIDGVKRVSKTAVDSFLSEHSF